MGTRQRAFDWIFNFVASGTILKFLKSIHLVRSAVGATRCGRSCAFGCSALCCTPAGAHSLRLGRQSSHQSSCGAMAATRGGVPNAQFLTVEEYDVLVYPGFVRRAVRRRARGLPPGLPRSLAPAARCTRLCRAALARAATRAPRGCEGGAASSARLNATLAAPWRALPRSCPSR